MKNIENKNTEASDPKIFLMIASGLMLCYIIFNTINYKNTLAEKQTQIEYAKEQLINCLESRREMINELRIPQEKKRLDSLIDAHKPKTIK